MPKHCIPCNTTASALSQEAIIESLKTLDGYALVAHSDIPKIQKPYPFKRYNDALDFVNAVAKLSEAENHHPHIVLEWGKVTLTWWTHAIGGLHPNDFTMAALCDSLYQSR